MPGRFSRTVVPVCAEQARRPEGGLVRADDSNGAFGDAAAAESRLLADSRRIDGRDCGIHVLRATGRVESRAA